MIAGDDPLTARVLEHATRMRIISKWGVGTDGIDKEAAQANGITVTNTPGVFGDDVADVAAGYLVMLARQLHRIDASVRFVREPGVSDPNAGEPFKLVWLAPTASKDVAVEFLFTDLPIPE